MGVDSRHEPSAHQAFKLFVKMRSRRAPALPLARRLGGTVRYPQRTCLRETSAPALIPY
jgi:hypothetical protein